MALTLNSSFLQCDSCIVSGAESICMNLENLKMKLTCFFKMLVISLTLEGPCIIFAIYIQSNEIHNVVALIKFFSSTYVSAVHVSDRNGPSSGASC